MADPYTITESDVWTDPVTAIGDGQAVNSQNLRQDAQALANRTKYLKNRIGAASGIATLDGSSRLVELPKNAVVAMASVANVAKATLSSATWEDIAGSLISLGEVPINGDLVDVDVSLDVDTDPSGANVAVKTELMMSTDGGTTWAAVTQTLASSPALAYGPQYVHRSARVTLSGVTGAVKFRIRHEATGYTVPAPGTYVMSLRATAIRP